MEGSSICKLGAFFNLLVFYLYTCGRHICQACQLASAGKKLANTYLMRAHSWMLIR